MLITTEEFECKNCSKSVSENYVLGRKEDKAVRKSFTADNDVKRVWDWN